MKKLMIAGVLGLSCMLVGCDKHETVHDMDNTWVSHGRFVETKVAEIDGHKYIIINGARHTDIIHAYSCGCGK